jgi:hypothetical protein
MLLFAPYSSATLVSGSKNVQIILGLVLNCVPRKSQDLHRAVENFALQLVTGLQHGSQRVIDQHRLPNCLSRVSSLHLKDLKDRSTVRLWQDKTQVIWHKDIEPCFIR